MIVYLLNLMIVIILSILAVNYSNLRYVDNLEIEKKVPNLLFVSLIIFCLMSIYALRWYVGTDFGTYYGLYLTHREMDISEIIGTRDWGFYSLASIINKIVPNNFVFYNYVLAALTYIPAILILRKYSKDFIFSIILYITMMVFYEGFNGVRQAIAVSLCFLSYPLLYKKRYFHYTINILFVYLFHSTALLMIPLMFIIVRKAWSKAIIVTVILLLATVFTLPSIWDQLISFLDNIGQEKMADDYSEFNHTDDGINILRVLVALVPVTISFLFYKRLKYMNPKIDILINLSLLYLVFLIFGTKLTVLARLASYFGIFNTLLIPELTYLFKEKQQRVFRGIAILLFFIYMVLILPVDSNLLPYRFIFNL